ncbi:helix-turn-helix transcriptional regulator [Sphingomonas sp. HF-S4]|uniref:Helix-turn-helix transcriptional regulator n=1 Tax=Sphingomonas agrestis TaxID=3080540 RepID=A0ABU3Y359_9SPHN|nr:helix-turn-helix transcriptional regulator [Sphingomonas sp. HF-S4]MDV3455796.1 helix-turn-helix transcriptional regulator [Sphingomonas sp. HF-S4]
MTVFTLQYLACTLSQQHPNRRRSGLVDGYARLSDRQKECLRLVGQGYTSKQIGRFLTISDRTVDNHIYLALELIGASSRAEAARALAAQEAERSLPKQPPALAQTPEIPPSERIAVDAVPYRFRRFVPPLGGVRNTIAAEQKIYAVVRVAVLGIASVIALSLTAAVLLWLIR